MTEVSLIEQVIFSLANCKQSVYWYKCLVLLLSLVSFAIMLLAVVTQVTDWCVSIHLMFAKFVSEFSLLFVCSVDVVE